MPPSEVFTADSFGDETETEGISVLFSADEIDDETEVMIRCDGNGGGGISALLPSFFDVGLRYGKMCINV